jgi:predicted dehydrogenase
MGMVGGGQGAFIGAVHRMAAALDGKIELVCGAFSQNHDNTLATGRELGLSDSRLYGSYDEMFAAEQQLPEDERMEFVCIVTPNHLHVPVAIAAAKHGFHIMSDKPAGISSAEVKDLSAVLSDTGVLYGLTHTYLGYPMVWQARHLVTQPDFGDIRRVYVEYPQGWLGQNAEAEGSKQAEWRTDPKRAGIAGAMGDIGSHAHNLVEFVTGSKMTEVSARLRTHIEGRRLDDDGEVSFTLANGATGVLTASQVCTGEENSLNIRVYGENAGVEWHQMEPNTLLERQRSGTSLIHRAGVDKPLSEQAVARCRLPSGHPEGYLEAFANLYRGFAAAIRSGEKVTATGVPSIAEALRGMAFLEAIVDSTQSDHKTTNIDA